MGVSDSSGVPDQPTAARFETTLWTQVLEAPHNEKALATLCRKYWYPLYAFLRQKGISSHDAEDLTQGFFAHLLSKQGLETVRREYGKFRSFLLASLKHFLVNEWVRGQAQKRGGGQKILSMDEEAAERIYQQEPASPAPAESLYDKRWAVTLLERAVEQLATDYAESGKEQLFSRLKPWLLTEISNEAYRELSGTLGMSEGALKVALHRLRQRFREAVRDQVSQTVSSPADVDEELRCLMAAMSE